MKTLETENKKQTKVLFLGLPTIAVIVAVMCVFYINALRQTMEYEADRYLTEVSEHISSMVNYRVRVNYRNLTAVAETYMQTQDKEKADEYLRSKVNQYGFRRMGIVGLDGISHTTDGYMVDMSQISVIHSAMEGRNMVSGNLIASPIDGDEALIYAVPLRQGEQIVGALAAISSKDSMRDFLSVDSFEGEGFSQIIDYDGNFVVNTDNPNAPVRSSNFFKLLEERGTLGPGDSLEKMKEDMEANRSGMLTYTLDDGIGPKKMNYVSLEVDDWYLLCIVPTNVTAQKSNFFVRMSVIITISIVLLFLMLIALIMWMQRKSNRNLLDLAFVDHITGGFNRARFEKEASEAIAGNPACTFALASMDIQKFKLINDCFGSDAGNQTLKHVYQVICKHLREGEFAARLTADNFNILMRNGPQKELIERLEKIVEDINSFNKSLESKYYLPFSEGVYIIDDPALNLITIQDRANVARKNSKEALHISRLSSCMFYTDLERVRMVREKEIDNRMESALENGEFVVYLQPKVELQNNTVAGAEALVRWQDPELGLIPPGDFIPVFEKNGFIIKLDLYVFKEVCSLLRGWLDRGVKAIPISVNLSRAHLNNPEFLMEYKAIADAYRIPPKLLEIELTETLFFENMEALIAVIAQIHEAGFNCSLDDFGSGYSSLNMLKDVPVDILKLDRAFFNSRNKDSSRGYSVIESVIELAKKLGMKTISEGVELESQVEFLRKVQCDMVQGFVFSKPLPVEEFERMAFKVEE